MKPIVVLLILFFVNPIFSQDRILIDGLFADWSTHPLIYQDEIGDGGFGGIDFSNLKVYNDEEYVFIYFTTEAEINIQSGNNITLYLDTDIDSTTGFSIQGIGAELEYSFGERQGFVRINGNTLEIDQQDIGIASAPSVSGEFFEIAIKLDPVFYGVPLFQEDQFRFVIKDHGFDGDEIPQESGGVLYTIVNNQLEPLPFYTISKPSETDFRILSYNVLFNGLFEPGRVDEFNRILQALDPDIIAFQEIYGYPSSQVASQVEFMLPSEIDEQWYHASAEPDIHLVSRFPILGSTTIQGVNDDQGNGAFLIDLQELESQLFLINAHTPCCENDAGRQWEIDAMMSFLRDAMNGVGEIILDENTPIVICGDMNLVGNDDQLNTLITGDISNEGVFGVDFNPDWDGSNLIDSRPYTTGLPMTFSWYNESSSFSPGRLDFQVFSGSNLEVVNEFNLFTQALPLDSLNVHGLIQSDSRIASDHIPSVVDYKRVAETSIDDLGMSFFNIYPNPSTGQISIAFDLEHSQRLQFSIIDQLVKTSFYSELDLFESGPSLKQLDLSNLSAGIYLLRIENELDRYQQLIVIN